MMTDQTTTPYSQKNLFLHRLKHPLLWVLLACLCYWIYLIFATQMEIQFDSIDYKNLGQMLASRGFSEFFRTGPHREPVYPLVVAVSFLLSKCIPLSQTLWLKILQVLILCSSQLLLYMLLKRLSVHRTIACAAVCYLGFSPALVNSAFSLYSEIATYPFILGFILLAIKAWEKIEEGNDLQTVGWSLALGLCAIVLTLTKAAFELILPLFLLSLSPRLAVLYKRGLSPKFYRGLIHWILVLMVFQAGVNFYKYFNLRANGNYVLTDRGSWALYGNTERRVMPLTLSRFWAALTFIPGEGVCQNLADKNACQFWSAQKSDEIAFTKLHELEAQGISGKKLNNIFLSLSLDAFLKNPIQYAFFYFLETFKLLFWESTQIGWVTYPAWLASIFSLTLFKDGIRLLLFLLTFLALKFWIGRLWSQRKNPLPSSETGEQTESHLCLIVNLVVIYILIHAFFFVLTRYALPLAPLYLVLMAAMAQKLFIPPPQNEITEPVPIVPQRDEQPKEERKIYRP